MAVWIKYNDCVAVIISRSAVEGESPAAIKLPRPHCAGTANGLKYNMGYGVNLYLPRTGGAVPDAGTPDRPNINKRKPPRRLRRGG